MSELANKTEETMPPPSSLAMGQMGMWLFLGTEVMFFAALLATYLILRFSVAGPDGSGWPTPSQVHLNPWIGLANTAILLFSSILVSVSVQGLASGNTSKATRALLAAIALGVCFLSIKGYEYYGKFQHHLLPGKIGEVFPQGSTIARRYDEGPGLGWLEALKPQLESIGGKEYRLINGKEKSAEPVDPAQLLQNIKTNPGKNLAFEVLSALDKGEATPSDAARKVFQASQSASKDSQAEIPVLPALPHGNLWASCYFTMTGLHGIHLIAGLVALSIPALLGLVGKLRPRHFGYLSNTALYWHFVDLVWLVLFPLLYLV